MDGGQKAGAGQPFTGEADHQGEDPAPSLPPPSHPLWSGQPASQAPVATHLVTLLTRASLGSSLSSGTLSPQRTVQLELNLPVLTSQGRTSTRGLHVHLPLPLPHLPLGLGDLGGLQILVRPEDTKGQNRH